MSKDVILQVHNLKVKFDSDEGSTEVLHGVNFGVKAGRTLGLVGESGSGKSVTAMSIMGLLPKPYGAVTDGEILYRGKDLVALSASEMCQMRGDRISIIFQDPMTALNPVQSIGQQLCEVLILHRPEMKPKQRYAACIEMLNKVKIPLPEKRMDEYPHNLSGGMRQRIMIAMALACRPDVLICDEPTTALDVTVQSSILQLMNELQQETGMAMIFITHDLGVVAEICDDVAVMYGGKIVEQADVFELFDHPKHAYTKRLLSLMPSLDKPTKQMIEIKPMTDIAFI
ncbi:ABC transporter ATP-binding protein [Vibrio agarivorans]|uniref:ABC transporter ATP-binding protein n=1 Tax=Vibrio agarivorans TaxID=153622 RepID=UPI00222E92E7|nr:ABC transporter ATP-binding protein [Vibrio agarivorans]MDN3660544.1 ABC transporter ATP-binding protein [Vibrio agarivorans]